MVNKKYFVFLVAVLVLGLVSMVVWAGGAATSVPINVTTPANGTYFVNYTSHLSNTSMFVNVTFINETSKAGYITAASPALNVTISINSSGTWTRIGTVTTCFFNITDVTPAPISSCAGNISLADVPEGVYVLNATLWNGTAGQDVANWSANVLAGNITFNNVPRVTAGEIVRADGLTYTHGANVSGTILINVSVEDYFLNATAVKFNVTNTSGGYLNWTYKLGREGTTNQWSNASAWFNTEWFPDGMYNITFYAEDTFFEMNDTEMISNIYIDNTAPTAVTIAKLDSTRTTLNATITITDAGSGGKSSPACTVSRSVGGSQMTISENPGAITQNINDVELSCGGTYKYTATCTDAAGNSKVSAETSVTIDACPTGGLGSSGSGGGVTWTYTDAVNGNVELSVEGVQKSLGSKQRVKLMVNSQTHYVGVTDVTASTAKIQVSSTPQDATMSIGDVRKFDVDSDAIYDVQVTLNAITDGKADVTIISIVEAVTAESEAEQNAAEGDAVEDGSIGEGLGDIIDGGSKVWIWVVVILVVIVVGGWFLMKGKSGKKK